MKKLILLAIASLLVASCGMSRAYEFSYDPATGKWSGGMKVTPQK